MTNLYQYAFLPQNCIAEEILLGIILIYPNVFSRTINKIKNDYFFLESHKLIYINLVEIYKYNQINIIILIHNLEKNKLLNQVGGLKKITNIIKQGQVFTSSSRLNNYIEELLQLIIKSYLKRLIIQCGHNIIKIGYIKSINNEYLYKKATYYLNLINISKGENEIISFQQLISEKLITIKNDKKYILNHKSISLLKSGFIDLDNIISGLPNGDLIIIAGRPSMGKTSLAINIAYNVFYQKNISICIFSLEMKSEQILNKFISIASKISIEEYNNYQIEQIQWETIKKICNKLLNQNIYINNKHNINLTNIESTAKNLKKNNNTIELIIIDYLQLIQLNEENIFSINRSQELSYITRKLKLLAQLLKLPIIALSQLNRNIEIRNEKKPLLSDLKESGCISYTNNIKILNIYSHELNLSNINKIPINSIFLKNIQSDIKKLTILINKSSIKNIFFFKQYIFKCLIDIKYLLLTYNHKYLSKKKWIPTNHILDNTRINYINLIYDKKFKINQQKILIKNIYKIIFKVYAKSYDININNYFNFISENIILHNSIEQDADIIMILHEEKDKNTSIINQKILDITVCKNRNGPTGQCEIIFIPETTVFKNLKII